MEYVRKVDSVGPDGGPVTQRYDQKNAADTQVDRHPALIAQRKLIQAVQQSPRLALQRQMLDRIEGSTAMTAQRSTLNTMLMKEEDISESNPGTVQAVAAEPELTSPSPAPSTPNTNQTGLPDNIKSGIEALSGLSMDHVRVHYNSSQPAQMKALAYAQGSDIHLGPGQESHLPHEAWHVVQQAKGRVRPTFQMKGGTPINDDAGLEQEADTMGARAASMGHALTTALPLQRKVATCGVVQRTSVELESYTSDQPRTVVTHLKRAGIAKIYLGVDSRVDYKYERVQTLKAVVHPGGAADITGNGSGDTVGSTSEIGGLGNIEAVVVGYPGVGSYAGGHLVGARFWASNANSLLEENLVPMRTEINSSIYKILENEVAKYVNDNNARIYFDIELHYDGTHAVTMNQGHLQNHLDGRKADTSRFDFTQSFNLDPHVPDKITVKIQTYAGEPDLPKRTLDNPMSGDITKSQTYDKPGYVDNIGWDASRSKLKPQIQPAYWQAFRPVKLKSAGARTYHFFQETI